MRGKRTETMDNESKRAEANGNERMPVIGRIPNGVRICLLVYITIALIAAVVAAPFTDYLRKIWIYDFNILFLGAGVVIALIAILIAHAISSHASLKQGSNPSADARTRKRFFIFVALGCVILLAVKVWLTFGAYFTGSQTDASFLTRCVVNLVKEENISNYVVYSELADYISVYPNNKFLTGIFFIVATITLKLGLNPYPTFIIIGCISIVCSVGLAALIAEKLAGIKTGVWTFLLAVAFVGLSPWSFIPYSDSYGIIVPTLVLFLYLCVDHEAKWALMVFVSFLGYSLKPTLLAPLAAIVVAELCWAIARSSKRAGSTATSADEARSALLRKAQIKRFITRALSCIIAFAFAYGMVFAIKAVTHLPADDPNTAFGPAHFLKMGANVESAGAWFEEDLVTTKAQPTRAEKDAYDLSVWQERLVKMGPLGAADLLLKKTLANCTEGDFDWYQSRQTLAYFMDIKGDNEAVQSFYGIEDRAQRQKTIKDTAIQEDWTPPAWTFIAQTLWMLVLAGTVLNWMRRRPSRGEVVICITLLLICLFHLIFESSARYIFCISPLFCILAIIGWQTLASWFATKRRKSAPAETLSSQVTAS